MACVCSCLLLLLCHPSENSARTAAAAFSPSRCRPAARSPPSFAAFPARAFPTPAALAALLAAQVVQIADIEIVHFERVIFGLKNFDMVIVFKDLKKDPVRAREIRAARGRGAAAQPRLCGAALAHKPPPRSACGGGLGVWPWRLCARAHLPLPLPRGRLPRPPCPAARAQIQIGTINMQQLDQVKTWLDSCNIKFYEGVANLHWPAIMKTVRDDPLGFYEGDSWRFLDLEQRVSDGEEESEEDEESSFQPSGDSEEGGSDESDDSDSDADFTQSSDDDSDDGSGADSDESSGKDWDELEKEAVKSDRKRGLDDDKPRKGGRKDADSFESGSSDDSDDDRPKKKKGGGGGKGAPPKAKAPPPKSGGGFGKPAPPRPGGSSGAGGSGKAPAPPFKKPKPF